MWHAWETQRPRIAHRPPEGSVPRSRPGSPARPGAASLPGGSSPEVWGCPVFHTKLLSLGSNSAFQRAGAGPHCLGVASLSPCGRPRSPSHPLAEGHSVARTAGGGRGPHSMSCGNQPPIRTGRSELVFTRTPSPACAQGPASVHSRLAAGGGIVG